MTSRPMPQCAVCRRLRTAPAQTCEAYPDGIPDGIWWNRDDHRKPQPFDNGLHWMPMGGAKFPEYAMADRIPPP